tara:strand:+ start:453 stop:692 length:240 start_codon:yes stop_codon:yes gene_type:complete
VAVEVVEVDLRLQIKEPLEVLVVVMDTRSLLQVEQETLPQQVPLKEQVEVLEQVVQPPLLLPLVLVVERLLLVQQEVHP